MIPAIHMSDAYKTGHIFQYPQGTTEVYSNMTARGSRIPEIDKVVVFGIQYFVQEYLVNRFNADFFTPPKEQVVAAYQRRVDMMMGPGVVQTDHIGALHDLGYLPLTIKALPEGSRCPMRVPFLTIKNTHPDFAWVTNWVESILSNVIWQPITSATIAHQYRQLLDRYAAATSDLPEFVQWQGHDFSMRGMSSLESSMVSGAAHLLSFTGTDTIPAIDFLEAYYHADATKELIGGSVPATEHSVQCMGGEESELETFRRLMTDVYPTGIVSIVSDTWDYWKILTETLVELKPIIMAREGKVVIRPDSGDPVKIICGDPEAPFDAPAHRGTIQILWDIFGGTVNWKGYKQLDPHIGAIYGDSITYDRAQRILQGLEEQGFASTNIVFGIGSYTYQYNTRDTFGMAMKATSGVIDGKRVTISKNPKTDDGLKKSAKGLLCVMGVTGAHGVTSFHLLEEVTEQEEHTCGALELVFQNGPKGGGATLQDIRTRLARS